MTASDHCKTTACNPWVLILYPVRSTASVQSTYTHAMSLTSSLKPNLSAPQETTQHKTVILILRYFMRSISALNSALCLPSFLDAGQVSAGA